MRAIILAGGRGTRLRPLTDKIPKALIPVNGIPMIERCVRSLKQAGIKEIFIVINYKASMIKNYFADKPINGIKFIKKDLKNKRETFLLLKKIFHDEKFLLFATDHMFEPKSLMDFLNRTKKVNADLIISTCEHGKMDEYRVIADKQNNVIDIIKEKKQHYETGFVLYSTNIFEIANKISEEIKHSDRLIKLLLDNNYGIKVFKTPGVYDIDNLYSLKKIEKILQEKELKWSFWVIPSQDIKKQLSKITSHINKKYKVLIPLTPHVTVKNEIALYKEDKKIIENILKEICDNTKPFEIKLQGIEHSSEPHRPVFLVAKKTRSLLKFNKNLSEKLHSFWVNPQFDFKNFKPHLSLAYGNLNRTTRLRVIKDIEKKIDSHKFSVNEAHIVNSKGKPKDWKILKSFKLGG